MVAQKPGAYLRIHCFGTFRVFPSGSTEPQGVGSKHKVWSLFKYLITNKGAHIPNHAIFEEFWPKLSDLHDTSVLRTTICRLRSLIDKDRMGASKKSYIIYTRDTCAFNQSQPYWMDTEEFIHKCGTAHRLGFHDQRAGLNLYGEALELYQGDFLEEDLYQAWTEVHREYYRRLFVNSTIEAASWAIELSDYRCAQNMINKAIIHEPLSESLHILLIRVLLGLGEKREAAKHYDYCSGLLYRELGVRPSEELKKLYQQIKEVKSLPDQSRPGVEHHLPDDSQGPFFCGPEFFQNLLIIERRRLARNGGEASMVLMEVNLSPRNRESINGELLRLLEQSACQCLRKSDVICRMDNQQMMLYLPDTGLSGAHITIDHISKKLRSRMGGSQIFLAVQAFRVGGEIWNSNDLIHNTSA